MNTHRRAFLKAGSLMAGAALLCSYPIFIERQLIQMNSYKIHLPRLPSAFEGFTIVQLTDIHYGPMVSLNHLQRIIHQVLATPRDMIVCTGDFVLERHEHKQIDTIWPLIATLNAPAGVLSVLGNHDHWADSDRSLYWMEKTGQSVRHRIKKVEKNGQNLWFVGAGDLWEDHYSIDTLMEPIPKNECSIVLAHNPDSADTLITAQPDLVISGHTHGGQVRIPVIGAPLLPVENKNYTSGLKWSKRSAPVFISRGVGYAVYPVRFNCLPEVAVLTLTAKA